jgi:hypothetical protein
MAPHSNARMPVWLQDGELASDDFGVRQIRNCSDPLTDVIAPSVLFSANSSPDVAGTTQPKRRFFMQDYGYLIIAILVGALLGFAWAWSRVRATTMGVDPRHMVTAGIFGAMVGGLVGLTISASLLIVVGLHP